MSNTKKSILIEAVGSPTSGFLINAAKQAGLHVLGADLTTTNHGKLLCDEYVQVPKFSDRRALSVLSQTLSDFNIDYVLPCVDEGLLTWAKIKETKSHSTKILISEPSTLEIFQDKWRSYLFFKEAGIPTPESSLEPQYSLTKPRNGRGSVGIAINNPPSDMDGFISQERIEGIEYTVDILCAEQGTPEIIVPRIRSSVVNGKSVTSRIDLNKSIIDTAKLLTNAVKFSGPINAQMFLTETGDVKMIEVNPRIASGMALSFFATGNWIAKLTNQNLQRSLSEPKQGLTMHRFYSETYEFQSD